MTTAASGGELTAELRRRASEEGFDRLGVARAAPLERDAARLEEWLAAGRQASMGWMERNTDRRADPRVLLPGCRAVVVCAANYWPGPDPVVASGRAARVARYARGRDYHKVLGKSLKRLAAWLAEASGGEARAFVDTAPVLERGWAERAGVGWIGKNANLLTRDMGSWLLLGEILTTADLDPDPGPHEEFCGTCTACLDACPTRAIVADGVVDSERCIAYWTIEHRGPVPAARRSGNGDWVFGCDVCQDVCPWNQSFARPAPPERFSRREDLRALDPGALLALDEAAFRARYSGTALMRAKWEGMRRNACIVLGNRGDERSVPSLATALRDRDPVVRGHAAWALGRIGGDAARMALESASSTELDPTVLEELRRALDAVR